MLETPQDIRTAATLALAQQKYFSIKYNGRIRDVYPFSIQYSANGARLFAWCSNHPDIASESFIIDRIEDYSTSINTIDREFDLPTDFL